MIGDTNEGEEELFAAVREIFVHRIPFNKLLGIRIDSMSFESARVAFDYRSDLVGNFIRGSLHGGVVSAALDLTGGLVAFLAAVKNVDGRTAGEKLERLANVGTIDMRVDYLRPATGGGFLASAYLLRSGSKVSVTRMELHNDQDVLVAAGTGTYLVG